MMDKQVLGKIENGKYYFNAADKDGNRIEIIWDESRKCYVMIFQTTCNYQCCLFEPDELKEAIELLEILISKGI